MIEISSLPKSALIDTGVFIRFLGERPDDPKSLICKAFCMAMLDNNKELYIAAPTITEATRNRGRTRVPHTSGITVIAFDYLAAERLGIDGPETLITEIAKETKTNKNYIKYDYMIAACAVRAHAKVLVAWDDDYRKICLSLGMPFKHPLEFLEPGHAAAWHKSVADADELKKATDARRLEDEQMIEEERAALEASMRDVQGVINEELDMPA